MAESQKGQLDELLQQMEQVSRRPRTRRSCYHRSWKMAFVVPREENMEESLDQLSSHAQQSPERDR
ncbi:MAG: hypothetical protein CM1200mP34_1330 [Verrucomicrobiales bacterium]|nr:MAG: hypothetical protein CM1200mP34_1330 [Verrucomicrobiales bacterium]